MTAILGISAYYHDSAAALVVDGQIVAAAQEERFTRKKHDPSFPRHAIRYCLDVAGLQASDLDHVGFYDKPIRKFDRLLETYLAYAPAGYRSFRQAIPIWLRQKLHLPRELDAGLGHAFRGRYIFTDHHESHAASAFFPSPFDEAAILTIDGVGEWSTTCIGVGQGNRIRLLKEIRFPHSLGLLYSAFTYYLGFKVNSGEYKVMGLAPYGEPIFRDRILERLIDLKEDGSFRLDMRYFNYCQGLTMTGPRFHQLFGSPPRPPESLLTQREMDLAASLQSVTEEVMLRLSHAAHRITGLDRLVLAGGVALNCVANGRILREAPFRQLWIQPAAGDAGGALGVAQFIWYQLLGHSRKAHALDDQLGSLLGPEFSDADIAQALAEAQIEAEWFDTEEDLIAETARLLATEKVVGWFQGRMEFGPRALGARSILGDPRSPTMQSLMNQKIKFRESFRPFAPIVLREHIHEWFECRPNEDSPYMLLVFPVLESRRVPPPPDTIPAWGIDRLNQPRSEIPAVTHVDYSARVQTVDSNRQPLLHRLLSAFHRETGCPVLVNTSFNVRGEPIVCTPADAIRCFRATEMDVLILGRALVRRQALAPLSPTALQHHLAQFELD